MSGTLRAANARSARACTDRNGDGHVLADGEETATVTQARLGTMMPPTKTAEARPGHQQPHLFREARPAADLKECSSAGDTTCDADSYTSLASAGRMTDTFAYDAADAQAARRPCRSKRLSSLARIGSSLPDRRSGQGQARPFQSRSRGPLLAGRQSRHSPAPSARTPLGRAQIAASRRSPRASRQAETNGSRGQGRHGSQRKPRVSRMLMNGCYATPSPARAI